MFTIHGATPRNTLNLSAQPFSWADYMDDMDDMDDINAYGSTVVLMWDCKKQYETAVPVLASCPSLGIQGITYWRIFTGQLVFFQFDHIRLAHYVGATADDVLYQSLVVVRSETDLMTHWDIHIFMCRTEPVKQNDPQDTHMNRT
jgi:hypothetical protein